MVARMTTFEQGDVVVAYRSVQGLREGEEYVVEGVSENRTIFGNFVTYCLTRIDDPRGESLSIGNGHLLLGLVRRTAY